MKIACSARFGLDFQMGPVPISSPPTGPITGPRWNSRRRTHVIVTGHRQAQGEGCGDHGSPVLRRPGTRIMQGSREKKWEMIGQLWSNMVELCQNKKDGDILGLSGTHEINKVNQGETSNGEEQPNKNRKDKNHQNKNKDANPSRPRISYITWII